MHNKTKNYVISLVIEGRTNPSIFFGTEEEAKEIAIRIAKKYCFSVSEELSIDAFEKRSDGSWFISKQDYNLEVAESPIYGFSDKRFLVDVDECGDVFINDTLAATMCFDAANVGFAIATWLSKAQLKAE